MQTHDRAWYEEGERNEEEMKKRRRTSFALIYDGDGRLNQEETDDRRKTMLVCLRLLLVLS